MKILLTGGTGFLGKNLLELLLADERVERVDVLTRSKATHPNPKARVVKGDLSQPSSVHAIPDDVDLVVHLAGLYDFREPFSKNYSENVLGTLNLLARIRAWNDARKVPLLFASSYAVQFGGGAEAGETPLTSLPSKEIPYAYTKAVAERAVSDSGIPGASFRLGILVGSTKGDPVEKIDGPYALLHALTAAKKAGLEKVLKYVPIFGARNVIFPFVPVDLAARVFHEAIFREHSSFRIYGTYDPSNVSVQEFCGTMIPRLLPGSELTYFEDVPRTLLSLQAKLTGVPAEVFRFALEQVPLSNEAFLKDFPECRIPAFKSYIEAFMRGFVAYQEGRF